MALDPDPAGDTERERELSLAVVAGAACGSYCSVATRSWSLTGRRSSTTFAIPSTFQVVHQWEEQHLRHVEKDVLIPKIMREKARERCSEQVQDFTKCCKESGLLMVVKCRKENSALKECLTAYYKDPAFYEECKMEYLKEREEFRKTGIPTKKRLQKLPTSM
ncbi:COX assembly mitochondrial protein homolog isoform X1 [Ochotona curzoniae]|uniref:COX assembly mitochondrial protein homolog isoform X1 n=2 Tax=Ochotona TaxID=9977 RepID=UPI001B34F673|nr:COX assembly mitochondrial protein homolog isoform X1 [Ochotona curzoniae]